MLNIVEFPKISIKMKNFNTSCETQTASHFNEVILQIKAYYVSGIKIFLGTYAEIGKSKTKGLNLYIFKPLVFDLLVTLWRIYQ